MKPLETLVANKWHPQQNSGLSLYPTPQSILRAAVGSQEYKFVSETVTTEHIRAAVIMPLAVPFQHLLAEVPWGMTYTTPEWRMLIVSVADPVRWLDLARLSGAQAWLKGHNMTVTYNWEMHPVDEHGLKRRPPNAMGITGVPDYLESGRKGRKDRNQARKYNQEEMVADLRHGFLNQTEIGLKYSVSRITVMKVAKMFGIETKKGNPHRVTT